MNFRHHIVLFFLISADCWHARVAAGMRRLAGVQQEAGSLIFAHREKKSGKGKARDDEGEHWREALPGWSLAPAPEEPAGEDIVDVPAHQRKVRRGRKPLDPALAREVIRHELPEGERVCPHDGSALKEIGVEASEQLDIVPQQVRVIRHERVKYACPCCDGSIKLAARPAQIIPRGLLTEAAMSWIVTAKYDDGLPLYRIAALMGRFGGSHFNRNTLAATVVRLGAQTQPLINLMKDLLLDSCVVHGDETQLQVLKEPGRAAQTKSWLWAQSTEAAGAEGTGPPIRLYSYTTGRGAQAGASV